MSLPCRDDLFSVRERRLVCFENRERVSCRTSHRHFGEDNRTRPDTSRSRFPPYPLEGYLTPRRSTLPSRVYILHGRGKQLRCRFARAACDAHAIACDVSSLRETLSVADWHCAMGRLREFAQVARGFSRSGVKLCYDRGLSLRGFAQHVRAGGDNHGNGECCCSRVYFNCNDIR